MKRFVVYRPNPPENYVKEGYANPVDQVQVEGVVFSDGSCVIRWCTSTHSTAVWNSFDDFQKIHGHPEYGTKVVWLDE
jgi:hypothetical protein